jgi:hypothetical protein
MKLRYGAGAVLVAVSVLALPVWIDGQSQAPTVSGVSGSMAHNSQLTISGSSFGTKPAAAPIKHDDFQNLAIGQNLNANGWRTSGYLPPVAYNGFLRSGTPFTRNAHSEFQNGISYLQGGDVSNFYLTGLTNTRYYIDAWHYMTTEGTPEPQNIKPWRLHQANAGEPNAYFGFAGPSADDTGFGRDGTPISDSGYFGSSDNGVGIPLRGSDWYNHWQHLQILIDVGTPGSANGTLITYVNGALRVNYRNNIRVIASGYSNFPELYLGNYIRSDPHGTTHAYWESVYVDGSWARVEVGNNASYAACTKRETQIPTSWSSNSISVRVNRGSFPSLDGLYLFVVDATGTPSPGYRLGTGSGTDVQPPASPTNVRVIR